MTGPILKKGLLKLKSGLPIPQEYFQIVLDETSPKKMLSFIYKQSDKGALSRERTANIGSKTQGAAAAGGI